MTNLTNYQLRDKNLNLLNNLVVSDEVFEEFQERRKHMTYLIAEFNHLVNNLIVLYLISINYLSFFLNFQMRDFDF